MPVTPLVGRTPLRVIGDVIAHFDEPVESFVRRRHAELRLRGVRNEEAYRTIVKDLGPRLVSAPDLSERQVRRIIYG